MTKTTKRNSTFTAALARSIRPSTKNGKILFVRIGSDGLIYATNGEVIARMNWAEYDEILRPVAQRDPGDFSINPDGTPSDRKQIDLEKIFTDYTSKAAQDGHEATPAPFVFDIPEAAANMIGFYNADADAVTMINTEYYKAFNPEMVKAYSTAALAPVVLARRSDAFPVGVILPIRPKTQRSPAAVRAYFTDAPAAPAPSPAMEKELAKAQADRADAVTKFEAMKAQRDTLEILLTNTRNAYAQRLQELTAAPDAAPAPTQDETTQAAPAPSKANELKAALDKMGVSWMVKGERTAAPVLWADADKAEKADELKAAGMTWSNKRGAWYAKI